MPPPSVTLLGPQRKRPTIAQTLDELGLDGELGAITAGWQERESEDGELSEHVDGRSRNLHLYARAHAVFRDDPELSQAIHERQAALREQQELYRLRLEPGMDAVRELCARPAGELVEAATEEAFAAIRKLDAQHLERVSGINHEFEAKWSPTERPAVARERAAIATILDGVAAVAIAGGHVAVLLNRMRLFDLTDLIRDKPVIAWSAGAMVAGERIVLFHDRPPQGPGYAGVLEHGLGLYPGLVPFPHARARLELDDPTRVSLLARRFAPSTCVCFEVDDRVAWTPGGGFQSTGGQPRRLGIDGAVSVWRQR